MLGRIVGSPAMAGEKETLQLVSKETVKRTAFKEREFEEKIEDLENKVRKLAKEKMDLRGEYETVREKYERLALNMQIRENEFVGVKNKYFLHAPQGLVPIRPCCVQLTA